MRKETVICKLCLEPIFNFICIDCQHSLITKWLLGLGENDLLYELNKFHIKLKEKFSSFQPTFCIKCKQTVETPICPYCYVKEVFYFFSDKNTEIAKKFIKFFNYDFNNTGYHYTIKTENLLPVIITDKRRSSDLNFCEECGEISDLTYNNGKWLCEDCKDENES